MRQGHKKKNLQEPQPPQEQEGQDSYRADSDGEDEQIPDDGEYTSSHQSIDLQQYLRNRDNIPSQPSDVNQDDYDQDDEQQDEENEQEEQPQIKVNDKKQKKKEQQGKIKQATSPEKPSKKERVQQKRQQKQSQKNSEK